MTQRNNPMAMMMQMMQSGGNPNAMLQQMAKQNPQVRQFMQMIQNKTPQEKEQMVRNMCKERGTTPEALARSMGVTIPSNR